MIGIMCTLHYECNEVCPTGNRPFFNVSNLHFSVLQLNHYPRSQKIFVFVILHFLFVNNSSLSSFFTIFLFAKPYSPTTHFDKPFLSKVLQMSNSLKSENLTIY